jgi:hypothetical protein
VLTNLSRKARVGLLTGATALLAAGAVSTLPADAQVAPVLTVSPPTITVGQSADLIATGCVADADQADLYVVFGSDEGGPGGTDPQPTDAEGTATFNTGRRPKAPRAPTRPPPSASSTTARARSSCSTTTRRC